MKKSMEKWAYLRFGTKCVAGTVAIASALWFVTVAASAASLSITITNPASNTVFQWPATIRLNIEVTDDTGTLMRVEYFANTNLIGLATNPPYSIIWSHVMPTPEYPEWRSISLTAVAVDSSGLTATSAPVIIYLTQDVAPPYLTFITPTNTQVFTEPADVTMMVNVRTWDGSENPVQFFVNSNLVGTVDGPPYTLTAANVHSGDYYLYAWSRDPRGNVGKSAVIKITVGAVLRSPTITLEGWFRFDILGNTAGRSAVIQASGDLSQWSSIATNYDATSTFTDTNAFTRSQRFYRLWLPP